MSLEKLNQQLSMPLEMKIEMTKSRIREWIARWNNNVYISFSGGKDSTVLLDLCRQVNPNMLAVFSDTGLEYPEIREFVLNTPNTRIIKPTTSFYEIIKNDGYPIISKEQAKYIRECQNGTTEYTHNKRINGKNNPRKSGMISKKWQYLINAPFKISERCCDRLKKKPFHIFQKETGMKPIIGIMAGDSSFRKQHASRIGCFNLKEGKESLRPIIFWTEQDIWNYIKKFKLPYCDIYNHGVHRTGCIFCGFGCHLEKRPNRFELLKLSHPQLYKYCMEQLNMDMVLNYIKVPH